MKNLKTWSGVIKDIRGIFLLLLPAAGILLLLTSCKKNIESSPVPSGHVHGIIPLPLDVVLADGYLTLDKTVVLVNNTDFSPAILQSESALEEIFNSTVTRQNRPGNGNNILFSPDASLHSGEYRMEIGAKDISIKAGSPVAAFYAAQSLRQMIWNATLGVQGNTIKLREMTITDEPAYPWRGFHLDVARHMFTKEYLFRIIDWMAYYKLNKLHLHLTDDQGWRIEIDQFPLLTEIGAWRDFNSFDSTCLELSKSDPFYTIDPRFTRTSNGKTQYGGYYTKQDLQAVIDYASANYIDVIPELDMPGHMSAAIRAYPELSCADSAGWSSQFSYPICPCNQQAMDFAFAVWDEVCGLFPSNEIHIGCDEVQTDTWASSSSCQTFMQVHNMQNVKDIEDYFIRQLQDHLQAKGKTVIAWDDVIDGSVDNNLLLMYWRDWVTDSPSRCASNGNSIILTPVTPFYFSADYSDQMLENLYNFSPVLTYDPSVLNKIIGMQSCVWTETIPSEPKFEQFVFPRMQALSEICWSTGRDLNSFKSRMKPHFSYMIDQGIHYSKPAWMK